MTDISSFSLRCLDPNDSRKPFDCRDDDLNDFFHHDSADNDRNLLSVTFVLEDKVNTIAFFSLLNDKISVDESTGNWWKKHIRSYFPENKNYRSYPSVKIGRIGIYYKYQGTGIGSQIMDYIKVLFLKDNKSGCRFLTVDAYNKSNVLRFYERNDFMFFKKKVPPTRDKTRLMYFDLMSLLED